MSLRIFICAGDPSGDGHAAMLMQQLHLLIPGIEFTGIGGPAMQAQGLNSIVDFNKMNIVGFWEVVKNYPFLKSILDLAAQHAQSGLYDAFIPVDYPGFNLRLAKSFHKKGCRVFWYIAPQLWAWGISRAESLRQNVDLLLTVFPFEQNFFSNLGINTQFVGHPLLDKPVFQGIAQQRKSEILLMPGSRVQEIQKHAPILNKTSSRLYSKGIATLAVIPEYLRGNAVEKTLNMPIYYDARLQMKTASAGLIKAGTSTLEAALLGLPGIVYYKTSAFSYLIAKNKIKLPWISLPNILLDQMLFPEFIQNKANPLIMADELMALMVNHELREKQMQGFEKIRSILGGGGASAKAAKAIAGYLSND
jgi:lipid-A-disaccharide synthase